MKFEKNFKMVLSENSHSLDVFEFSYNFVQGNKNVTTAALGKSVWCKNLIALIEFVKKMRSVTNISVKFGIVGGGEFFNYKKSNMN